MAGLELDHSFSAVGSCYESAAVESFFATLKRELAWIHQQTTWPTEPHYAPRCSTTSKPSTTPNAWCPT